MKSYLESIIYSATQLLLNADTYTAEQAKRIRDIDSALDDIYTEIIDDK